MVIKLYEIIFELTAFIIEPNAIKFKIITKRENPSGFLVINHLSIITKCDVDGSFVKNINILFENNIKELEEKETKLDIINNLIILNILLNK